MNSLNAEESVADALRLMELTEENVCLMICFPRVKC